MISILGYELQRVSLLVLSWRTISPHVLRVGYQQTEVVELQISVASSSAVSIVGDESIQGEL
jgi:hypothetical protein